MKTLEQWRAKFAEVEQKRNAHIQQAQIHQAEAERCNGQLLLIQGEIEEIEQPAVPYGNGATKPTRQQRRAAEREAAKEPT